MSLAVQIDEIRNDPVRMRRLLALAAAIAITLFAFRDALWNIIIRYNEQEELSHSYFIPFIAGWLAWSNRSAVMSSIGAPSIAGVYLGVLAAIMLLLGPITYTFIIQDLGFIVAIMAIIAGFGGTSLLRVLIVPIAFLTLAIPIPYWTIQTLSWNFQNMSSELGVIMVRMMGIPVHLSGNVIDLGVTQLQVAEACSGLRYLFPFMTLGIMAGYLFNAPLWQRIAVFLSTIPITIIMNSLRIAVTSALVQAYGPSHTEGFLHFFEGWVVFLLCLAFLIGVIAAFSYGFKPRRQVLDSLGVPPVKAVKPKKALSATPHFPIILSVISGLFVATIIAKDLFTTDKLIVPERKNFASLVDEFPDWRSNVQPLDSEVAAALSADDYIVTDFVTTNDQQFNVYLAYLTARRHGSTWHSPRQCIPGGGWEIVSLDIVKGSDKPGALPFDHNRMVIEYNDQRQIVYYWYDQRGREIANEYVMKLYGIYDAVTRRRGDGALARVMMPVEPTESIEDAERDLIDATMQLKSKLPAYIPE